MEQRNNHTELLGPPFGYHCW